MRAGDPHGMQGRVYMHAPNQPLNAALPNFTSTQPLAPAPPLCQPMPQPPLDQRNPGGKGVGKTCSACKEAGYPGVPSTQLHRRECAYFKAKKQLQEAAAGRAAGGAGGAGCVVGGVG
jgi:hypothetical protein